jgi:3-oxoadipate enol-lactonase / 4-carboxymuconolactone decarboxylase
MTVEVHYRLDGPDRAPGPDHLAVPHDAPVVMFANSLGTTLEMWDAQAAALSSRYRVLRFDMRGHGRSPGPPGPYTVDDLTDDAIALLDRLGIARVAFCGLSLGGAVGMTLAVRAPERLERLVLCCTALEFGPASQWLERAATARTAGMAAIAPAGMERWFTPNADPGLVARFEAMLRAQPADGYAACCEAIAALDLRGRLRDLRVPVLTIGGADDPVTPPAKLDAIRAEIPGSRGAVIQDARHLVNVEQAARFTALLTAFLAEGEGMRVRREVLGDAHVDRAIAGITDFTADFQAFITRYAWGEIWTRPGLDRRMRSAITITALVALGHENELAMHVRAGLRNGLTPEEIKEILLHSAVYCGVPAANSAFAIAQRVLEEG